jgi:hypothetical protein
MEAHLLHHFTLSPSVDKLPLIQHQSQLSIEVLWPNFQSTYILKIV